MFHEFHCLRRLQNSLFAPNHPFSTPDHIQHCLTYLRQRILCKADDGLEEGDAMSRNFELDRVQGTMVCEDWSAVYDFLGSNSNEWDEIQGLVE